MEFVTQQKEALKKFVTAIALEELKGLNGIEYLLSLKQRCLQLAGIVHLGQLDNARKPYINHPMRVAAKAPNVLSYCGAILHDVIEDGAIYGITREFLIDDMKLPLVLVNLVDALNRRPKETYHDYVERLIVNYQAAKIKIDDGIDNSDVSRFDNPTQTDLIRCQKYLAKVCSLKSREDFQHQRLYDMVLDITALSQIAKMQYYAQDVVIENKTIYSRISFSYEGKQGSDYFLILNGVVNSDGTVNMDVATYPSYDINQLYMYRKGSLVFESEDQAEEYITNVYKLLNLSCDRS